MPKTYFCRKWRRNIIFQKVIFALLDTNKPCSTFMCLRMADNELIVNISKLRNFRWAGRPQSTRPSWRKLCRAGDFLTHSASFGVLRNYASPGHWPAPVTSGHIRPMGGIVLVPGRSPHRRAFVWAVCRCRSLPAPRVAADSRPHSSCGCRAVQTSRSRVPPNSVRRLWVFKFPPECLCDGGSRTSPRRMLTAHGKWSRRDIGFLSLDGATWTRSIYKM